MRTKQSELLIVGALTVIAAHCYGQPQFIVGENSMSTPTDELAAVAGKQYQGDGLSVTARPGGAERAAWARMREHIRADEMSVREMKRETGGREWQLANHPHDLAARFDGSALELSPLQTGQDGWRLRMEFAGYGRGMTLSCPATVDVLAVSNRVEYWRGSLTEWWRNEPSGLEHGFTLYEPPSTGAATGPLRLALALRDGIYAQAAKSKAQAVELADATGAVVRYGELKVWDATGQRLPAWLEVEEAGQQLDIVVDDAGARFPVVVDPTFVQMKKLTATDGAAFHSFGQAVSVSDDIIVVGGGGVDIGGSAYVFERNRGGTNNWGLVKKLTASDGAPGDYEDFGAAVCVSGNIIVVGALQENVGANFDQGSAYLFERNAGGSNNWGQIKKLVASDGAAYDRFGTSVSASGNIVIVGAEQDTVGLNSRQGSAYLFERNAGGSNNWGQIKRLVASDGTRDAEFGSSVSVSGNVVVVGARSARVGTTGFQGAAYVFERDTGGSNNWGQIKKLIASDGASGDSLGQSVSVNGDVVVVGADQDDEFRGSAYVFERNAGGLNNWGQVKKLTASDRAVYDRFGSSVSVSGDVIVAGASGDDSFQGSAYVFERNAGGANNWGQTQKLIAFDRRADDQDGRFGNSVSIDGELVTIGARFHDVGANVNQGAAYVFEPAPPYPVIVQHPQSQTNFAATTAILTVNAAASEPLSYQWRTGNVALADGGRVSGSMTPNLVLTNVQLSDAGGYRVVVSNSFGSVTSQVATLTVLDLSQAVDTTNLVWISGGNALWSAQSTVTHDGVDALRSGPIFDLQQSWLQTTVTGPGTLAFWWRVSSEMDYDVLEFSIDGVMQRRISGEEVWQQFSFAIAAGTHTLRWSYVKDDSTAKGQDRGWLDEVVFMPASGPPAILAQPGSMTVGRGATATFNVGVGGGTPRTHQWFKDNTAIPGATAASLTLSNITLADVGTYHLAVANSSGSASSSNALLRVTTNGPIQTILLFSDQPSSSPYLTALSNLGRAHQLFGDFVAFNNVVSNANPATTLVIVNAPTTNAPFNAVGRFANAGGRAIFQAWTLAIGNAVAAAFQANVVQALLSSPSPVYDWSGVPFYAGLPSPLDFTDRYSFSGQKLQAAAGGLAVAGYTSTPMANQAAIVIGHSGRTVFNGFLLEEVSAFTNAVRLAQNEIDYFFRGPIIVAQPTNKTVLLGGTVTNTVSAMSPTGPLTYQWQQNGINIPNATSSNYTIIDVQVVHEGDYTAVVSDQFRSATSNPARLTVLVPPRLVAPVRALNFTAVAGERITLGVQVDGTLPMFCRWRVFRASGGNQALSDQIMTQRLSFLSFTSALNSAGAYVVHLTNIVGGTLIQSHTNALLILLADSDGDGLPDVWETTYPMCADPALDCDDDGLTNLEEYQAGTDPTNAASVLEIDRITAGNSAMLEFQAVSNKTYTVQHSGTLASNSWLKLVDIVARTNNRTEAVLDPAAATNRFYRLVTPRQP